MPANNADLVTLRVEVTVLFKDNNVFEATTPRQLVGAIMNDHPEIIDWRFLPEEKP
jgi:hypothetical protein